MKIFRLIATYALLILVQHTVYAQSLPVGTASIEDYYRREQLRGAADTNVSFTVRPIFPKQINTKASVFYPDSSNSKYSNTTLIGSNIMLLPVSLQTQINSNYPYGWNDGPMIPAKGLQTLLSAGIFASYGPLTIQLKPEFVYAANNYFSTFNPNQYDVIYARYYDIYNNIDLPARFGTGAYTRAYWGQSSIRLNLNSLSFGLSTENLWWGPGIENSLVMSNTAPGFPHLTLNTLKPIQTSIGSFEGQLIAGRLGNSGYPPLEPDHSYFGTNLYVPKPDNWRYLSGIILSWQPKWIPGVFVGFDQTSQSYGNDLSGIKDYLPLFLPFKKTTAPDNAINAQNRISTVFMRWLWTREHAELYFEWGQYNNTQDFYQGLLNPNNSRAYVFGLRKLLPFNKSTDQNILIGVEVAQLGGTSISAVQSGQEWYVSNSIRQGYTNQGQELGAGIGPGGNSQSLNISWVKGLKKLGLQFERYVHNNDFYYYAFEDSKDYTRHWVDMSLAATGEWNYKNLLFNARIAAIQALDYQWALKTNGDDITFANQTHAFNLQIQAGVSYRF